MTVSARASSKLSPTLPTDGAMPASARRRVYVIEVTNKAALDGTTGVQGLLQGVEHEAGLGAAG
jgi:hypothetical protein